MSPTEALKMLDNVAASAPVNRATQIQLMEALRTLDAIVNPPMKKEKDNEHEPI